MHADDQYFLVVRTIEDTDVTARGEIPGGAPQVVMFQLLHRGRLERCDLTALRVALGGSPGRYAITMASPYE